MTQTFEEAQASLIKKWLDEAPAGETPDAVGDALVDFIIRSELLRHGVDIKDPTAESITRDTLAQLSNPLVLGPEHSIAEVVFRRLAVGSREAVEYLEQHVSSRSAAQSKRAQAPRKRRLDSISRLVNDIVSLDPKLSAKAVRAELKEIPSIKIIGDEIINRQDACRLKLSLLPSRVSDAKKRFRSQE